ncbi:Txe/YoeB family addiction module toxin [Brachyspira pulli]|uniref:Txe/YoeB family addiction module toxin n=1 Tax=Brachyspira pulli TaxID=310721 RepID=UPI0030063B1F
MTKNNKTNRRYFQHPETGIGKPEKLKYEYSGLYSRRITEFHRIIYKIDNDNNSVIILSLYGHYD